MATTQQKKRGLWTPNRDDIEAFREGRLTTNAQRIERVVDQAFEAHRVFVRAKKRYEARLAALHERMDSAGGSIRAASVDGKRQVTWSQRRIVKGNANAERAGALIQDVAGELLGRTAASDDERTLATFLQGVIQRTRGRIIMNANLVAFTRLKFTDARLVEAQKLLRDAFDVSEGKVYACFEVFDAERGTFLRAEWDEEGRRWTSR